MLNPASRFEENAEAHLSLVRPLAIFFVIALVLAATSRQPVQAASREHASRHSASIAQSQRVRAQREYATVSHKTRAHSTKATASRHEQAAERAVSSRGRSRVANSSRRSTARSVASRNSRARKASLERVSMSRPSAEPMARPFAGAGSVVEAAPKAIYGSGEPHPASETGANAAVSLSASEMTQAAVSPRV